MKKYLGTITILIKDRQASVDALQKVLTENGRSIRNRLGVNVEPTCMAHCLGFMVLVVEGTREEIGFLTKKISDLRGITAESTIVTD